MLSATDCIEIRACLEGKATNCTYSDVARWFPAGGLDGTRLQVQPSDLEVPLRAAGAAGRLWRGRDPARIR